MRNNKCVSIWAGDVFHNPSSALERQSPFQAQFPKRIPETVGLFLVRESRFKFSEILRI
jgi:hypothetical protein